MIKVYAPVSAIDEKEDDEQRNMGRMYSVQFHSAARPGGVGGARIPPSTLEGLKQENSRARVFGGSSIGFDPSTAITKARGGKPSVYLDKDAP